MSTLESMAAEQSSGTNDKVDGQGSQKELQNGSGKQDHRSHSEVLEDRQINWKNHQCKYSKKKEASRKYQWRPKTQVTSYFVYNMLKI